MASRRRSREQAKAELLRKPKPRKPALPITKQHIDSMRAGADLLAVITDRVQEVSEKSVVKIAAIATADAYFMVAQHYVQHQLFKLAAETLLQAKFYFRLAKSWTKARVCEELYSTCIWLGTKDRPRE